MLDNLISFFKKMGKKEDETTELLPSSGDAAKERLHLVLMQDRANVSVDFMDMMKQEIIDVIKKYIDIDEKEMDVRLTNQINEDGTNGVPALYANIPIVAIKNEKNREINIEKNNVENKTEIKKEKEDKVKNEEVEVDEKPKVKTTKKDTAKKENKEVNDVETKEKKVVKTKKTAEKKAESSGE